MVEVEGSSGACAVAEIAALLAPAIGVQAAAAQASAETAVSRHSTKLPNKFFLRFKLSAFSSGACAVAGGAAAPGRARDRRAGSRGAGQGFGDCGEWSSFAIAWRFKQSALWFMLTAVVARALSQKAQPRQDAPAIAAVQVKASAETAASARQVPLHGLLKRVLKVTILRDEVASTLSKGVRPRSDTLTPMIGVQVAAAQARHRRAQHRRWWRPG